MISTRGRCKPLIFELQTRTAARAATVNGVELACERRVVRAGHVARVVAAVAIVTCPTLDPIPTASQTALVGTLNFSNTSYCLNVPTYIVSTAAVDFASTRPVVLPARLPPLTPAALRSARESTTPTFGLRTRLINVERAPFQVRAIQSRNCPTRFCRIRHLYESETA